MNINFQGVNPDYRAIIKEGIQALESHFSIIGILLFGSLAKNKEKAFDDAISDVDLIIIVETLPSTQERLIGLKTLDIDPRIRIILQTPEEIRTKMTSLGWMLDALSSGKTLYDPQKVIKNIIDLFQKKLKEKRITETDLYWERPINLGDEIEL